MPALQIHLFTPETNPGADALYLVRATGSSPWLDRKRTIDMKEAYAISRILLADVYDATAQEKSAPAPPRQRLRRLALTLSTLLFAAAHAPAAKRATPDEALDRLNEMTLTIGACESGGVLSPAEAVRLRQMSEALDRRLRDA